MHEMSLVREIVKLVLAECDGKGVTAVKRVHLTIGEAHDVVDRYVPEFFAYLARGTIAQNAEVAIERVPFRMRCNACAEVFGVDVYRTQAPCCPACGATRGLLLHSGTEFSIDSIEVETDGSDLLNEQTLVSAGQEVA